ncbi:alkaline phosphatase D family protein [Thermonema rossianum]|uniref:alkaline phosphatase D family protein n=1 Tax=Thermonema rossianum TaxID=55505 RepID=UPI000690FC9F|nr:alkaline phosphatase D family protein [Thermonema rossianum]
MQANYFLMLCCLLGVLQGIAQPSISHTHSPATYSLSLGRAIGKSSATAPDPALAPFYHGVASGDPLPDKVIIWTRVTPSGTVEADSIEVRWIMALDSACHNIVQSGLAYATASRDFTVKVDVDNLQPATTYYYYFQALGANSVVGRTRTAPSGTVHHLRFAVVSCSNFEAGFFNAYEAIARREDLDAVIHLGDYIYEYGQGTYGAGLETRRHQPAHEILTLADYRTRYSLYRLDPALRKAHQQHPFICVWDDHESANDAYKDGAENHNPGEGSWEERKRISKQVYYEWMPVREQAEHKLYRVLNYGDLADIFMIDTRLEGREIQINDVTSPELYNSARTLLGEAQKAWLKEGLKKSKAQWKMIGNQVIFSELNLWWAAAPAIGTAEQIESSFLDIWDGYPAERKELLHFIEQEKIHNLVWLTGDFHCAFAFDVPLRPAAYTASDSLVSVLKQVPVPASGGATYDEQSGKGTLAIEFATPSITSANFDENLTKLTGDSTQGAFLAKQLEYQINRPLPASAGPLAGFNPNPHLKYVDLTRHGYLILDLKSQRVQADWFYVPTVLQPSIEEFFAASYYSDAGTSRLRRSESPSEPKSIQPPLAPSEPLPYVLTASEQKIAPVLLGLYPNPANILLLLNYAVLRPGEVNIEIWSMEGKLLFSLKKRHQAGNYTLSIDTASWQEGGYILRLQQGNQRIDKRVIVRH